MLERSVQACRHDEAAVAVSHSLTRCAHHHTTHATPTSMQGAVPPCLLLYSADLFRRASLVKERLWVVEGKKQQCPSVRTLLFAQVITVGLQPTRLPQVAASVLLVAKQTEQLSPCTTLP